MDWLNYHHLYYFWVIGQEGGLSRAAERLRLTHSTLSAQLRTLEAALGGELFERRGRRLVLTPFGTEVSAYAADIFRMGTELMDLARGRASPRRTPLRVGIVGAVPKTVAYRLLEPALSAAGEASVSIRQDESRRLLEELAAGKLHVVIADAPPPESLPLRVHSHLLGETEILLYGSPKLARRYGRDFPRGLVGAPMLLPGTETALRRALERWFVDGNISYSVAGEIDDAGLLRVFGGAGRGLFPVRAALRTEVEESHGAVCLGTVTGLRERYYAISLERRVRHPGVAAIIETARTELAIAPPSRRRT